MRDADYNKLQELYESVLNEEFSTKEAKDKAKDFDEYEKDQKEKEESDKEDSKGEDKEEKDPVIPKEKEERIKKFHERTKGAPSGSPGRVLKKGGRNFTSIQSRKGSGTEAGWGFHPYERVIAKALPQDITGHQSMVSTPGKQYHGQEPLPQEEKGVYVVTYKFQNKKVEDTVNTPDEAMDIIMKTLETPGYELIGAQKKIETQDIAEQF